MIKLLAVLLITSMFLIACSSDSPEPADTGTPDAGQMDDLNPDLDAADDSIADTDGEIDSSVEDTGETLENW